MKLTPSQRARSKKSSCAAGAGHAGSPVSCGFSPTASTAEPSRGRASGASVADGSTRSFLGGADKLAVEACEVGPTEPGAPTLFDVWVRPAGAEFAFSDPSAALVLVGPRHRRARRAWERGTIAGSPVAFASYLVPAPVWTPYLAAEAMRRWARRLAGRQDVAVTTPLFRPHRTVTLHEPGLAGHWDVETFVDGRVLLTPHVGPRVEPVGPGAD